MLLKSAPRPQTNGHDLHEKCYAALYRIRRTEQEFARIYPSDKIKSPVHLSIGQEAVAVGVCLALRPEDVVFGTYRGHALYLAKGGDLKQMVAELYGKATGCARGKGGSMHLVDVPRGVMGTSAVVATTIPNAVGHALAMQYLDQDRVTVSFFGEGATEEGVFTESINFAVLKKAPIIFVCENNRYAIHTHQSVRQPLDNLVERVRAYGIPAERIDGNDVFKIHDRVAGACADIRSRHAGPVLFECMTYRWMEHVGPGQDWALGYRSAEEGRPWLENDPVKRLRAQLPPDKCATLEASIEAEIREALAFAEASPFPDETELHADVFKDP